jgi:hypothetical protein
MLDKVQSTIILGRLSVMRADRPALGSDEGGMC